VGAGAACGAPGKVSKQTPKITVHGSKNLPRPLQAGDIIKTNYRGSGKFCLTDGVWECRIKPNTQLQVIPSSDTVFRLITGRVFCGSPKQDQPKNLRTPGRRLLMTGQISANAWNAGTREDGGGEVLSLAVTAGGTVARIRRGAAVLASSDTLASAVVLGKGEQSVAPTGSPPRAPTPFQPTKADKATFAALEKPLPKETDKTSPVVTILGPRPVSSVATAMFRFTATEPAVFSCALDNSDFRLCASPYPRLEGLAARPHTFSIRATDPAGNTSTTSYSWTVDGSRIVFESFRDGNPELYSSNPDGSNSFRVTQDPPGDLKSDEHPDWSPGQRQIAYDSLRARNLDIYVINADGTGDHRLTTDPADDRNPAWSPDGTRIAFESYREGTRQLYVMNADGSNVRRLTTDNGEDLDPTWSPDSGRIAFASTRDGGNYEIYVMNADGTGQTNLTRNPSVEFGPSWSRDGKRIAFHSLRTNDYQHIFVMNADGSSVRQITMTQRSDTNPAWAPDSGHIVFQSDRQGGEPQLYVVDADTLEETAVTAPSARANFVPDW
jgi:Tol biopolymer transport system component